MFLLTEFIKLKTLWKGVLSLAINDSAGNTEDLQAGHFGAAIGADQPIFIFHSYCFLSANSLQETELNCKIPQLEFCSCVLVLLSRYPVFVKISLNIHSHLFWLHIKCSSWCFKTRYNGLFIPVIFRMYSFIRMLIHFIAIHI